MCEPKARRRPRFGLRAGLCRGIIGARTQWVMLTAVACQVLVRTAALAAAIQRYGQVTALLPGRMRRGGPNDGKSTGVFRNPMLTWLKSVFAPIVAPLFVPTLYAGLWLTVVAAVARRAEWALYVLVILAPLPIVWYRLHDYPLGTSTIDILLFGAVLGILINKRGFQRAPASALVATFLLVSYVALWNGTLRFNLPLPFTLANPMLADWKNYAEMIFLYFIAYSAIRTDDDLKTVVVIMAVVFLLIVLRSARNFEQGDAFSYDRRVEGPFWIVGLGANHFGAFIAHYGALLFGLFLVDKHRFRKWLYLAAAVISLHPLFFAYSRGAYAAVLAVITVYGVLKKRSLLALVAVIIFAWQAILPSTVVERISMTESSGGEIEESAALRLGVWQHAMQLFLDNSIFGIGFNAFPLTRPGERLTDTHNFYMKTAAEQGMIGLIILGAVLLRALLSGWQLYRRGRSDFHRGLGLGFIGCCVAVAITNVFGDRWSYFALGAYFWVFWGLADRALRISEGEQSGSPERSSQRHPATTAR
jgi:putative inorganic carbon (hco3(-)) transporter